MLYYIVIVTGAATLAAWITQAVLWIDTGRRSV